MAVTNQVLNPTHALYNGDSCEVLQSLPSEKIHFSIYSPPFCGLYQYSSNERDLSNCTSYAQFFEHYDFIVSQIARVTMQGRCTAVHCTDIPSGNTGSDHLIDFPGDIIRQHERLGFRFIARHTIWKEPLWALRNSNLQHLQQSFH